MSKPAKRSSTYWRGMSPKAKSKSEELLEWMKREGLVSSVHIRQWGIDNFYISADRVVRRFAELGNVTRLNEQEIVLRSLRGPGCARVAWYQA